MEETGMGCGSIGPVGFEWALDLLKRGRRVYRLGWNGKGIFLELQTPTELSKMTQPYIYINTTGLKSEDPDAVRGLVPWVASQADLLAEDWAEYLY